MIDERNILYSKSLSPERVEYSENIFGITLDLANVEREILTPEILKGRLNEAKQRKQEIDKALDNAINEEDDGKTFASFVPSFSSPEVEYEESEMEISLAEAVEALDFTEKYIIQSGIHVLLVLIQDG